MKNLMNCDRTEDCNYCENHGKCKNLVFSLQYGKHSYKSIDEFEKAFIKYYYLTESFDAQHGFYNCYDPNTPLDYNIPHSRYMTKCHAYDKKMMKELLPGYTQKNLKQMYYKYRNYSLLTLKRKYDEVMANEPI